MCRTKPFLNGLICTFFALASALPLAAQLKPTWQATNSPDFLDLYQRSSSTKAKPEIVTIFDFSGSMQSLMYHPLYFNNDPNDNGDRVGITFTLSGAATHMKVTASVGLAWYTTDVLIRPDGTQVTEANVDTTRTTDPVLWGDKSLNHASTPACDVRNWVRAASHIRITSGARTIDLPIPWMVMDATSTGYPLTPMTVKDEYKDTDSNGVTTTYGSGNQIEMDTRYQIQEGFGDIAPSTQICDNNIVLSGAKTDIVTSTKFMIRLNKRYIDWLFTGVYQNTDSSRPDYSTTLVGKYIVFDAASLTNVGLQTRLNQGKGFGTFSLPDEANLKALALPARDRVQAVKEAAIRTWINYQTKVFWAYRFLDDEGEAGGVQNAATATTINSDSKTTVSSTTVPTTWVNGKDTGWTVLNKNSVTGMQRIAAMFPYTNTPLSYATARTLAQFTDSANVFGTVETGTDSPVECQKHFLIIFTDGVPSVDNNSEKLPDTPYITTTGAALGNAQAGNTALIADKTAIDPGKKWWNIFTYAGAAAHLSDNTKSALTTDLPITTYMDPPTSYPTGSDVPSTFLPFAITKRLTVPIPQPYRLVTTMTIGVSLGGKYTDANSPKQRLFITAAVGDPDRTSWDLSKLTPFTLKDPSKPNDPNNSKTDASVYFFDATTPDAIVNGLGYAFKETTALAQTASTSVPVIPWIGGGLGNQIYLAAFTVPKGGGPVWSGDLRMFPTKEVVRTDATTGSKVQTVILDKDGTEITGSLSGPTTGAGSIKPGWSASDRLFAKGWAARKVYTRLESTSADSNPTIYSIPANITAADLKAGGSKVLLAAVLPGTGADADAVANAKLKNLQWMMGADTSKTAPYPTRTSIMGDVVDSAPSFLEYSNPDASSSSMPSSLSTPWNDTAKLNKHFRAIFVGTNQGVIHAFGEVTWDKNIAAATTDPPIYIKEGVVDELWVFIPTDIIKYCDYYQTPGNPHRFGVNGTPYLYFLDLPASGKRSGNGKMDISTVLASSSERATLIMGLGKGGRSYYALDVRDPFAPKLGGSGNNGWALIPDEATSYPSTIFEGTADTTLISNMGWSTCQPTIGRVLTGSGVTQIIRDVVFLGGGFSLPEIEKNYPTTGANTPLGRSVLALDVVTGKVVTYWKLDSTKDADGIPKNGPVGAGVMPMQVIPYAGLTQRAYFTDFFGGLWALGSTTANTATGMSGFRVDSSNIGGWASTPRPVYHQDRPDGILSTLPAPFLVSNFYPRTTTPFVTPLTVGLTLVSGDRNNPMDKLYSGAGSNAKPSQHRLTVVFDRQDSSDLGLDTNGIETTKLQDMSSQTDPAGTVIQPGSDDFYLKTKYGYYLNFPARATGAEFVAKGLVTPMVLSGKLFYSYFSPTGYESGNRCSNGTGSTSTVQVCNVLTPTFPGTGKAWDPAIAVQGCASGEIFAWVGLASRFSPKSILSALQAGMIQTVGNPAPDLKIKSFSGALDKAIAGPKVWRTVH